MILFFYVILLSRQSDILNFNFYKMEKDEMDNCQNIPQYNPIFVPVEEIFKLQHVIDNLEEIKQELKKITEGMTSVTDNE